MTEVADAVMADPDDGSSDSESDFEEVEVSEEDMETISKLESELEANPNLYDKHVEVILPLWFVLLHFIGNRGANFRCKL